jgi:thiol-disulfide isomerase/thioredoxin
MKKQLVWIIGLALGFTLLFCSTFVLFYQRAWQRERQAAASPKGIDKPLPESHLIDVKGAKLNDDFVRRGRVVLAFVTPTCGACKREAEFLKTIVGKHEKVQFYGVISFGDEQTSLADAEKIFPFKVFFDEEGKLAAALGIRRVPIKIYLENGVIKKAWGGATVDEKAKDEFVKWLDSVSDCEVTDEAKTKCV